MQSYLFNKLENILSHQTQILINAIYSQDKYNFSLIISTLSLAY